jgi:hypothetical protein
MDTIQVFAAGSDINDIDALATGANALAAVDMAAADIVVYLLYLTSNKCFAD